MSTIDPPLVRRFVELAVKRLEGHWIIIGGAVLPLIGVDHRVTLDIDVAGPPEARMEQLLVLLKIAKELSLPVEAINQAGAIFLEGVTGFENHLIPVASTDRCTFSRPDATLYILLKIPRLSESDLEDCLRYLDYCRSQGEAPENERLIAAIQDAIANAVPARAERLRALLPVLGPPVT